MIKLLKLTVLLSLVITISGVVIAQAQGKRAKRTVADKAAYFTKEITDYVSNIDSNQYQQLLQINIAVTNSFDSVRNLGLEPIEARPAMKGIYANRDAAVKKVLNEQQYDEYMMLQAEKREEQRKKWQSKQQGMPADSLNKK
jgi:hypothetical protein